MKKHDTCFLLHASEPMKFIKDLLLIDLQTTGTDPEKDSVLQIAALLLDKDNLLEKGSFNSYVRLSFLESTMRQHAQGLEVDVSVIKQSQKIYDVVKKFKEKFGSDFLFASHNFTNILFLRSAFKKAGIPYAFDQHMIDLWTLGYVYTLNYGLKKMPTFNTFVDFFNLEQKRPYDANERVRLQAEILRKIIKEA